MSPENQGVFLAPERGDFSKNSGILKLTKMGLFLGHLCAVECTTGWPVGLVQDILAMKA